MPSYQALQRRADKLLKEGDALGRTVAGKRKLRACRRLRKLAATKKLKQKKGIP